MSVLEASKAVGSLASATKGLEIDPEQETVSEEEIRFYKEQIQFCLLHHVFRQHIESEATPEAIREVRHRPLESELESSRLEIESLKMENELLRSELRNHLPDTPEESHSIDTLTPDEDALEDIVSQRVEVYKSLTVGADEEGDLNEWEEEGQEGDEPESESEPEPEPEPEPEMGTELEMGSEQAPQFDCHRKSLALSRVEGLLRSLQEFRSTYTSPTSSLTPERYVDLHTNSRIHSAHSNRFHRVPFQSPPPRPGDFYADGPVRDCQGAFLSPYFEESPHLVFSSPHRDRLVPAVATRTPVLPSANVASGAARSSPPLSTGSGAFGSMMSQRDSLSGSGNGSRSHDTLFLKSVDISGIEPVNSLIDGRFLETVTPEGTRSWNASLWKPTVSPEDGGPFPALREGFTESSGRGREWNSPGVVPVAVQLRR